MRLLVVEDESKLAGLLARGLREEGYAVDIASTGNDAVWMAQAAPYDAILLDVMLPGADDYVSKPVAFDELLARVRALVRRAPAERPTVLEVGDLRLDRNKRRVWRGDAELFLSPKELTLLELFLRRPGSVLTRSEILDGAWDMAYERRSNVVEVYVRSLREKIGRSAIETVRGVGYRLREEP
jgi:two-component system OmpR family response regulator